MLPPAEKGSEHPLGAAIVQAGEKAHIKFIQPDKFHAIPGRGIEVTIDKHQLFIGNLKLMQEKNIDLANIS